MSITVNIPHDLQDFTEHKKVIRVKGQTVGECLKQVIARYPAIEKELFDENSNPHGYLTFFVNERLAYPEKLAKPVKDGDKIHIAPIITGG